MTALQTKGESSTTSTRIREDLASDINDPVLDSEGKQASEVGEAVTGLIAFMKETLGDAVSDVRASDRLTDSAVCLVASDLGPDRQLEKLLASAGRLKSATKPILEINPHHELIVALAALSDGDSTLKKDAIIIVCLSGRGDKDCETVQRYLEAKSESN